MSFKLTCVPVGHDWWGRNCVTITQLFGDNANDFYKQLGLKGHNGIDYRTSYYQDSKAPVYAAHDGYVVSDKNAQSDTAGRYVQLLSDETEIDGKPCKVLTIYFHLSTARISITDLLSAAWFWKKPQQRYVRAGVTIGYSGNTGQYTTGPHLHFGMYILWKRADGSFTADTGNGYDGAVDPLPFQADNTVYQYGFFSRNFYYNGTIVPEIQLSKLIIKL
jgi:murein DD-endopeptidase MepM/ murein hydrolase activator NlpD